MASYKITFTPAEPWFFGNEKRFLFSNESSDSYGKQYYIKSELMPSQSTVLGALRYILIPNKKLKYAYTDDDRRTNEEYIGKGSFNIDAAEVQSFGKIKSISPVFLIKNKTEVLIPAPLDHKTKWHTENDSGENKTYTPFADYGSCTTAAGKKLYAKDYVAKDELFGGFVSLADDSVIKNDDIFVVDGKVGINRSDKENGFFKKDCISFKNLLKTEQGTVPQSFSFAVYADIDIDDLDGKTFAVTLGQGKSPFAFSFTKEENTFKDRVTEFMKKHIEPLFKNEEVKGCTYVYCPADAYITTPYNENTLFAVTQTKDYRAYLTNPDGSIKKGDRLHRFIKAGSVFIVKDETEWKKIAENKNAEQTGNNNFYYIEGEAK